MASLWDSVNDWITGGSVSNEDYEKSLKEAQEAYNTRIGEATKKYNTSVENALAGRKSIDELNKEGKGVAAAQASNKAGIAKRNAKAAAMQTSGSKLMSAIQGARNLGIY